MLAFPRSVAKRRSAENPERPPRIVPERPAVSGNRKRSDRSDPASMCSMSSRRVVILSMPRSTSVFSGSGSPVTVAEAISRVLDRVFTSRCGMRSSSILPFIFPFREKDCASRGCSIFTVSRCGRKWRTSCMAMVDRRMLASRNRLSGRLARASGEG